MIFKSIIYGFTVCVVLGNVISMKSIVVIFAPPTVQYAEFNYPVHAYLLAADAACLQRPPWIIQLYIHTSHHVPGKGNIIIFKEDYPAPEAFLEGNVMDVFYYPIGLPVGRAALPANII
jgi:hypothetical protein